METLAVLLFYFGVFAFCVTVHESGHFLAGIVAGIPPRAMRVRLFSFPQHVALKSGEEWISPIKNITGYIDAVWRYLPTSRQVLVYVSGGFGLEALASACVGLIFLALGLPKIGVVIVWISLFGTAFWLILDGLAATRGKVVGDLSGLWAISKVWTTIFVVTIIALRAAAVFIINTYG